MPQPENVNHIKCMIISHETLYGRFCLGEKNRIGLKKRTGLVYVYLSSVPSICPAGSARKNLAVMRYVSSRELLPALRENLKECVKEY